MGLAAWWRNRRRPASCGAAAPADIDPVIAQSTVQGSPAWHIREAHFNTLCAYVGFGRYTTGAPASLDELARLAEASAAHLTRFAEQLRTGADLEDLRAPDDLRALDHDEGEGEEVP